MKISSFVFLKVMYFLCLSFGAGARRLASRMPLAVARDGPSGAVDWFVCEGSGPSVPLALLQPGVEAGVCEPRPEEARGMPRPSILSPLGQQGVFRGRRTVRRMKRKTKGDNKHRNHVCRFGKETFIMGLLSLVFYLRQIIRDLFQYV